MNTSKITFTLLSVAATSLFFTNVHLLTESRVIASSKPISPVIIPIRAIEPSPVTKTVIEENSPADVFKEEKGIITFNDAPTPGLVFRIQVMTSKTQVPLFSSQFKGLNDVREYYENGIYSYTVGTFRSPGKSEPLFIHLEDKGYHDSFLVAFKDDKPVKVKDAMKELMKR
jgi:N-acetylmuramoyl-L-alanine amidase